MSDATALAASIRAGKLATDDVLEQALDAIAARNPSLNAVVRICEDQARAAVRAGLPEGPLRGVPILLKDLGAPAVGLATTFGSALFAGAPAWTHDGLIAQRLRAAGAVIVGRSASGELGVTLQCETAAFGPTRNPHDLTRTSGGSSGGSAAAVAGGLVPLAHATDGCGSIRVPASYCGLFGLKPTRGRVSLAPDAGEGWAGMSASGCVSRSVRDTAVMLDVLGVPFAGDPYAAPPQARPYVEEVGRDPSALRIGVWRGSAALNPDVEAALDGAVALCAALGHRLEPVELPFDAEEAIARVVPIWASQLWSVVQPRYAQFGREPDGFGLEPFSWALARQARTMTADDYAASVRWIHRVGRDFAPLFAAVDVVLSPVSATPAPLLGELTTQTDDVAGYLRDLFALCPFTAPYNVSGQPAMSVPLHRTPGGLPVGVQFAARQGGEDMLLRLAAQLEAARPWPLRAPGSAAPAA